MKVESEICMKEEGEILSPPRSELERILLAQPLNPLRKIIFTVMPRFPIITPPAELADGSVNAMIEFGYTCGETVVKGKREVTMAAVEEIYSSLDKVI